MPEYCLVKHRISTYVIDGVDSDRNPDRIPVTGVVTFEALLDKGDSVVVTEGGVATTITLAPIEARITNGEIYHRGEEGVKLFAGGPDTNPERIRYRAKFSNLIAGGKKIELKPILFEAMPGGELTLSMAQPVPGKPYPGYSATIEEALETIKDAVAAEVDAIKWVRGNVPTDTTSIDQLHMGLWFVSSKTLAETLGLPDPGMGYLEIFTNWRPKSARWTPITASAGAPGKTYQSTTDAYGEWGPWVVPGQSQELDTPVDFNTLTTAGTYHRRYGRDDINQPTNAPGTLIVSDSYHPSGLAVSQLYMSYAEFGLFYRASSTLGVWSGWVRLDKPAIREADDHGALRRDTVVSAGLSRRGQVIGTAGRGAVALRFDHHLAQFRDKVLPLLKQYRLPWSQAINPGNIGTGNDTMTWADLSQAVHESGGEIWNHGKSHSNFSTERQADAELGTSLADLRAGTPSVWIDSFAAYGSGDMMGMAGWDTPEKFYGTYPGRLLLSQHFMVSGLMSGQVRPLGGPELVGTPYAPLDTLSLAQAKSRVNAARDSGGGITLMLHPNRLDTTGYMTTATFGQVLAYIAAERDSGRLRVLSPTGRSMADASVSDQNLLATGVVGSVSGSWSETLSGFYRDVTLGVPHEAEAWVMGSGSVTLRVQVSSPTYPVDQSHTVTLAAGVPQRLSVLVTPPMDTTAITVSLTGSVTHTGIRYRPI